MAELKLVIYENDKIIGTIQKETITNSQNLIKSLEEFRNLVNEKFTMIIEDDGHIGKHISKTSYLLQLKMLFLSDNSFLKKGHTFSIFKVKSVLMNEMT